MKLEINFQCARRLVLGLVLTSMLISSCAGLLTGSSALIEFERGFSYFNKGEFERAATHFTRATQLDPNYTKAYIYLGTSYISLKQWYSALVPLRTAYRLSPSEAREEVSDLLVDTLFALVVNEIKKGNFDSTKGYLQEYLELNQSAGNSTNQIVSFLISFAADQLKNGNLDNTYSALQLALQIDPKNSDAYIGLGRAYFKDGRTFDALNNMRKALILDPGNNEARTLFQQYNN